MNTSNIDNYRYNQTNQLGLNINNNIENLINKVINIDRNSKDQLRNLISYLTIALEPRYTQSNILNRKEYFSITKNGVKKFLEKLVSDIDDDDVNKIFDMCTAKKISIFQDYEINNYSKRAYHFMEKINIPNVNVAELKEIRKQIKNNFADKSTPTINYFNLVLSCADNNLANIELTCAYLENATLSHANLTNCVFRKVNLKNTNLMGSILIKADLTWAKLQNSNLQNANLREAILDETNLQNANLQGTQLRKTHLNKANLTRANLKNAILREAKLNKAILREAYLKGAQLQRANLKEADLTGADLQDANLNHVKSRHADFMHVNLLNANLEYADLREVNFESANLRNANLSRTLLQGSDLVEAYNLQYAILDGAIISNTNLKGIKLPEITIQNINFENSNLERSNLKKINLSNANLINTNFTKANLTEANLNMVHLQCASFQDAILDGAIIKLLLPTNNFNTDSLDFIFNHFNNHGSILTAIDSIHNKYKNLKIDLIRQIITWLELYKVNIPSISNPLEDILYNNSIYLDDQNINNFIVNKLLLDKIQLANMQGVYFKEIEIEILYKYIDNLYTENNIFPFIFQYNALINQIIYYCFNSSDNTIKGLGRSIKNHYLSSDEIQPFLKVKDADAFIKDMLEDEEQFIFIAMNDSDNNHHSIIVSKDYLSKFVYGNYLINYINWDNLVHIYNQQIQTIGTHHLSELFTLFKLFQDSYNFHEKQVKFIKLLNLLSLGNHYYPMFINAIKHKSKNIDLTSHTHQENLQNIFKDYLTPANAMELYRTHAFNINLSKEHFNNIIKEFTLENKSSLYQSKVLLCLAGVFAKYSSSSFFGVENDSPIALRYYAFALMNKALQLYKTIIPKRYLKKNSDNWKYKFLGIGTAFTCTATLSDIILDHCKLHFPVVANEIIPLAWK